MGDGMAEGKSRRLWLWVVVNVFVFLATEVVPGGVLGPILSGRFVGHVLSLKLELLLMLTSYFFGGFLIGLLSPRVRILEPAIGAALAVVFTWTYSFFTPNMFYGFRFDRVVIGSLIAFGLAMAGAVWGESVSRARAKGA